MILELATVAQLAASCAPTVAPETLLAIVRTESGFAPLAIGVNPEPARGLPAASLRPATAAEAVATAAELLRQGRRVDLGLAQLSHANLPRLGMSLADAFDPCRNLAAGARILREGFSSATAGGEADPQRALRVGLSRYNTGHPERGFTNGYVARVQASAEVVVPALRLRGETGAPARVTPTPAPELPADDPDAPPEWDVWARASYAARPRIAAVPQPDAAAAGDAAAVVVLQPRTPTDPEEPAE